MTPPPQEQLPEKGAEALQLMLPFDEKAVLEKSANYLVRSLGVSGGREGGRDSDLAPSVPYIITHILHFAPPTAEGDLGGVGCRCSGC